MSGTALLERIQPTIGSEVPGPDAAGDDRHIASIIHLTDLHLLLDDQLNSLPASQRLRRIWFVEWLLKTRPVQLIKERAEDGLAYADALSIHWLRHHLIAACQAERNEGGSRMPIIVAHTGDVEAHGAVNNPNYNGFRFSREILRPSLANDPHLTWIDVFGNHDVWPERWPLAGQVPSSEQMSRLPEFQQAWRPLHLSVHSEVGPPVEVFLVNSVLDGSLRGGVLAKGSFGFFPRRVGPDAGVIEELERLSNESPGEAVRVMMSHHPAAPLPRDDGRTGGSAENGALLRGCSKLHFVIAGHRHHHDPPPGETIDCDRLCQPPLRVGIAQLCAESPTQASETSRSFSVYRIMMRADRSELAVERLRYVNGTTSGPESTEFLDRPLQKIPFV